jgi:putative tryptophan/tyrosine transport system substrate-binding protein
VFGSVLGWRSGRNGAGSSSSSFGYAGRTASARSDQEPEYLRVFDALQRQNAEVLLVSDSTENLVKRHLIVDLAEKARLPTLYPFREFVDIGGLIAYAVDNGDILRRGADYVDLVLKGTKPGEIPIYQADKFATIVNLKTAKALGLQLPPAVLASADAVIE